MFPRLLVLNCNIIAQSEMRSAFAAGRRVSTTDLTRLVVCCSACDIHNLSIVSLTSSRPCSDVSAAVTNGHSLSAAVVARAIHTPDGQADRTRADTTSPVRGGERGQEAPGRAGEGGVTARTRTTSGG